ncbi:MAG TPA: phosphoribosylaminoimidazolesuccinocarboxamide synthase [Gammaproteobacteria bacterium]|nr:phosphoribosylaminoimidazolesuccinocarboxamide synthase [Gammaproteobacteria bacterium]
MAEPLFESNLASLPLVARGKVRDIYRVDDKRLLILATDRMSAFDVVLPDPIPGKGAVLTAISNFWFEKLASVIPNHLTGVAPESVLRDARDHEVVRDRAVVVRALSPLPIEAVVRGYLIGSGWKDYCKTGRVSGVELPAGLELAQRLREPIFTPSTKAAAGQHDENISLEEVANTIGADLARKVGAAALALYTRATEYARARGIIIADTKFEFGLDETGALHVMDEVLTPDSSRFWPADTYRQGSSPPSFDKQYVRDYLETLGWNKRAPGPKLPRVVIERTSAKYREALERLTSDRPS